MGELLRIETSYGEIIEGRVFTADPQSGCYVIEETPGPPPALLAAEHTRRKPPVKSFRVLKSKCMSNMAFIDKARYPIESPQHLDYVDLGNSVIPIIVPDIAARAARERRLAADLEEKALSIGNGVTPEAQLIFDAMRKILPCRWDGTSIVVVDRVLIREPYTAAACSGPADLVGRVRNMLEAQRRKIFNPSVSPSPSPGSKGKSIIGAAASQGAALSAVVGSATLAAADVLLGTSPPPVSSPPLPMPSAASQSTQVAVPPGGQGPVPVPRDMSPVAARRCTSSPARGAGSPQPGAGGGPGLGSSGPHTPRPPPPGLSPLGSVSASAGVGVSVSVQAVTLVPHGTGTGSQGLLPTPSTPPGGGPVVRSGLGGGGAAGSGTGAG